MIVAEFASCFFKPTKWESSIEKEKFLNDLASFVKSGFKKTKFTKNLYRRLSMTFGHIAHYNKEGFYTKWFESKEDQIRWVNHILNYMPIGDPEYTYSDAERAFKKWLYANI